TAFMHSILQANTLEELVAAECPQLRDEAFCNKLRGATKLQKLNLSHLNITDPTLEELAFLPQLSHLSLAHTNVTDFSLLCTLPVSLSYLNLSNSLKLNQAKLGPILQKHFFVCIDVRNCIEVDGAALKKYPYVRTPDQPDSPMPLALAHLFHYLSALFPE